ncbi:uncharacterized protein LOC143257197 isoform X2 [Tachypleus tridentatus]|uniref:uncharacterized protein LOC143257197 isoform X2 n=1 Tax=Tachypleus tridentatus TaxID=6853 RepID=UPI003FD637BA
MLKNRQHCVDFLQVANTAYVLGLALAETHQYSNAEIYFRQALEIYDKRAEPYRCLVSTILHCLGGVLYKLGKLDEALECYEKVLKMRLKLVPLDISSVGRTLHALANVHCDRGDHETAEKYYLAALMVKQNIGQEITLPVVSILSSLGYLYRSKRQLSLAVTCFTLALKIGRRLPESDEKVAEVLKQLSLTYAEIGEIKNAKKCLSRAEMIENKGRKKCGISRY